MVVEIKAGLENYPSKWIDYKNIPYIKTQGTYHCMEKNILVIGTFK
jgi:hypothetical protein